MKGGATRRAVLAASLTVPLLAAEGCRAVAGTTAPSPASDVAILREAIAAKKSMVGLYTRVIAAHPQLAGRLDPLLADNTAHLAALQQRLINPGRSSPRSARRAGVASPLPPSSAESTAAALEALRSAERGAAATLVTQLRTVTPSLAQLLASIAACEATHVAVLASGGLQ